MYLLWTSLLLSFITLVVSQGYYGDQHVNRQVFTNDGGYGRSARIRDDFGKFSRAYGFKKYRGGNPSRARALEPANLELSEDYQDNVNTGDNTEPAAEPTEKADPTRSEVTEPTNDKKYETTAAPKTSDGNLKAIAVLRGKAKGILYFEQIGEKLQITGKIEGLTNGLHAFHVHDFGDLSRSCESSGDHFNPFNTKHGSPFDSIRHVGDLGNVFADESGNAKIDLQDKLMTLREGKNSIIGHTIIIHENVDDLGRGGHVKSGRRVGCGIIGWRNELA